MKRIDFKWKWKSCSFSSTFYFLPKIKAIYHLEKGHFFEIWGRSLICHWSSSMWLPLSFRLTMQAACTASDTLPAFGSHQNTWQSKRCPPTSMMKAKVCTSRPTPIKDRKRTRHSTSTSSSSWWHINVRGWEPQVCSVQTTQFNDTKAELSRKGWNSSWLVDVASNLVFADGDSGVCHTEGYWGPVFFVGRTYQALNGSI